MIKHDLNDPSWLFLRLPAKYAGQNAVMTPPCSLLKKKLKLKKKNDVYYYATAEKNVCHISLITDPTKKKINWNVKFTFNVYKMENSQS